MVVVASVFLVELGNGKRFGPRDATSIVHPGDADHRRRRPEVDAH